MTMPAVKRVLLKLSGEVLMGDQQFGIDPAFVAELAQEVKAAKDTGLEICLVIGGGNIFRGMAGAAAGHGPRAGRLHGHAGDGDERAGDAERARADRRPDPRPVGDRRWTRCASR